MISYAQNFEDAILWRALKHMEHGFYIDIGAQDPVVDSVSLAFYEQGWRGVHVEPTPHYAQKLREMRPDEEVIEAAVGNKGGAIVFFAIPDTGLSTGEVSIAHQHEGKGYKARRIEVSCLPLSNVLDAHKGKDIHWLKIDVEGMEAAVIESWLPSSVRPWIVVIESTTPGSPEPSHGLWEEQILSLGYSFVYFDGVNRYYVSQERPELKQGFGLRLGVFDGIELSGDASTPVYSHIKARRQALEAELSSQRTTSAAQQAEITGLRQRVAELAGWKQAALAREADLNARLGEMKESRVALESSLQDLRSAHQHLLYLAEARQQQIEALLNSISWRCTAPLRAISRTTQKLLPGLPRVVRGAFSWVTLRPGTRPRRVARRTIAGLARFVLNRPMLAAVARGALWGLPAALGARLRLIALSSMAPPLQPMPALTLADLSPTAREIFAELRAAIDKKQSKS